MRLYEEVFKTADNAFEKCIVVPNGGGYFEGVKSVAEFSCERILLCFSRHFVEIEGVGLIVKKYCDGDLQLGGKIFGVRVRSSKESE